MTSTFHLQSKLYRLTFEDGDLAGFACTLKGVSLEEFLGLSMTAEQLATPAGRTRKNIEAQFAALGDLITEWNLVDADDDPVPVSYDELKKFDFSYVNRIMKAYMRAVSSVPKASNDDSSSGGTSPERSLGLAKSSRSQES